jgi:hypothetical protein
MNNDKDLPPKAPRDMIEYSDGLFIKLPKNKKINIDHNLDI